jgi:alkylation response protein AidB-like acyl-CoA dehydrogenase
MRGRLFYNRLSLANLYKGNPDLVRRVETAPWDALLPALERGFTEPHEAAPRDVAEGVDQIRTVLELVGELAAEEIAPFAAEVDRIGARLEGGRVVYAPPTQRALRLLAEAGLMGFILPREFGGMNLPVTAYTAAVEIVSAADAALMTLFALQGCGETVHRFGTRAVQERYLPRLCAGEISACMALTEPGAGSDLGAVATRARPEGGAWRIDGTKIFCTNGGAELLLVLARTEAAEGGRGLSLFAVDRGPGVTVAKLEEKLGIHGSPTAFLAFDGAAGALLGERGEGLYRCTLSLLHQVRLEVAAQAVGVAQAAQVQAVRYAAERRQFGRPLDRFAPVRAMLFENALQIEAARAIVFRTAAVIDRRRGLQRTGGGPELERFERLGELLTPLAKYYACEIVNEVTSRALQVHGGYGYTRDYPVERLFRDGRITSIYEGTSEIQAGALVRPLCEGGLARLFEEPLAEARDGAGCEGAAERLREAYAALGETAERLRAAGKLEQQGFARGLADATAALVAGVAFLDDARSDARSALLAREQAERARVTARALARRVGERATAPFSDATFTVVVEPYR